jgi:ABC-2 type transport system ATP-binding protein
MRKRLGLAVALVGEPDLLVLDEPLGGLDPSGARVLRDIVRAERDRGAVVFFSSHIMDQVETLCDRVGVMHDGELVAVETVEALRNRTDAPARVALAVESVPDGIADDLAALDGVADATVRDGSVRVACADPTAKAAAVARLNAAGVTVRDVRTESPSLEQVFVQLTDGTADA